MQIIILGMHRSGTSAVARLLNMMGAYFAPSELAMPPTRDNEKGYWERIDVVNLNESILQTLSLSWDRIAGFDPAPLSDPAWCTRFEPQARRILLGLDAHRPWMLKDPRMCLLLPFWRPLLEIPVCVWVHRNPIEIAQSLRARDEFPLRFGLALWEKYVRLGLEYSLGIPRVLVSHRELMAHPVETTERLYAHLNELEVQGLRLPKAKEIEAFIEPRLYHQKGTEALLGGYANTQQKELDEAFNNGSALSIEFPSALSLGAAEILQAHDDEREILASMARLRRESEATDVMHRENFGSLQQQFDQMIARETALETQLAEQQQALKQAEDREIALETQLAEQQQALKQAEDREIALETQLAEQQQALKQAEDRETALETQLAEQQQALAAALEQAQDRETTLHTRLTEQQQALAAALTQNNAIGQALQLGQALQQCETLLETRSADLQQCETLLKARSADLRLLARLFETLQQDTRLAFDSLTWRLGYAVAEAIRRLSFRKRIPLVQDHVAQLTRTYQAWRQTTSSLDPISDSSKEVLTAALFSDPEYLFDFEEKAYDFEEKAYLDIYPDVRAAVERGDFKNGKEHWERVGREEIITGKRSSPRIFKPQVFTAKDINTLQHDIARWSQRPLISIIMPVYNVKSHWLEAGIASVRNQIYPHWQLCIADDGSTQQETLDYLHSLKNKQIKTVFLEKNQGIAGASNAALALATGEFIAFMDNDDELTPDALYEIAKVINQHNPDLIYTDEDKLTLSALQAEPHFKSDYSPDLLMSQNYICHLSVYRKTLLERIGGFCSGYEGAQDYDLLLRFLDHTHRVFHIPKVLYHWRKIPGSTAANFESKNHAWEAGRAALEDTLKRRDIQGNVVLGKYPGTYRVRRTLLGEPKVSIMIPFKDHPVLLKGCLDSILEKTTYQNLEVLGISNNSTESETFALMEYYQARDPRIRFIRHDIPFNFSAINNYAVKFTSGEHLILLNNDITVITPDWIETLLEHSQRPEVGAVGAKLYYPDNTVQHGGVIVGLGGVAGHSHKYFGREAPGYFCRLHLIQNLSAVTAACLMVKKSLYEKMGGLNEKDLAIAFNDIDFCLRLREKNYLNVFTPYCELYHHESKSRGQEDNPERQRRFAGEIDYMRKRHAKILDSGDPYYNPNLTLISEDFGLA